MQNLKPFSKCAYSTFKSNFHFGRFQGTFQCTLIPVPEFWKKKMHKVGKKKSAQIANPSKNPPAQIQWEVDFSHIFSCVRPKLAL